jgi:hypothetical protein
MDIKIIDNFLEEEEFTKLQTAMLDSYGFPWYYNNGVVTPVKDNDHINNYQFTHLFYDNYQPNSEYFPLLSALIKKISPTAIVRIKANLNPVTETPIVYDFHVDFPFKCKTAIFYLNTNNGVTILDDGTELDSVANRIMIFDSSLPHTGTTCTDQKVRGLINLNYYE